MHDVWRFSGNDIEKNFKVIRHNLNLLSILNDYLKEVFCYLFCFKRNKVIIFLPSFSIHKHIYDIFKKSII